MIKLSLIERSQHILQQNIYQQMTQASGKSQRQKKKQKKTKQKALHQFLQTSTIEPAGSTDVTSTTVQSDPQEKVDQAQDPFCSICEADLSEKMRKCGFCNWPACSEHMRKKRKNKDLGKFVRICDNCEDRYLYSKYMKLELKNEETIIAHESIVQAARDEMEGKAKVKREAMEVLKQKQIQILERKKQCQTKWQKQLSSVTVGVEKLDKDSKQFEQQQKKLKQTELKLPPDLEEDYKTLELRMDKLNKQILKYDKLVKEASNAKAKRQKEMYDEYHKWEATQRQKINMKQQDCCIF